MVIDIPFGLSDPAPPELLRQTKYLLWFASPVKIWIQGGPYQYHFKDKKRIQYKINLHKILGADEPIPLLVKDPEGLPDVPLDVRVPELPKKSDLLSTAQITIIYQNKDVCACWYALIMEACVYQSR